MITLITPKLKNLLLNRKVVLILLVGIGLNTNSVFSQGFANDTSHATWNTGEEWIEINDNDWIPGNPDRFWIGLSLGSIQNNKHPRIVTICDENNLSGTDGYNNALGFYVYGGIRMMINQQGNVGIGTEVPDEKLTVNGTVHAEEIKLSASVPIADYVFEKYYNGQSDLKPDYKILTLQEIEEFTRQNHHLPNVPSNLEITKNGLHLKKMTNTLLEKIEELFLYTIAQEKQLKQQAVLIKELQENLKK